MTQTVFASHSKARGGGGGLLLYRYVLLWRVWFRLRGKIRDYRQSTTFWTNALLSQRKTLIGSSMEICQHLSKTCQPLSTLDIITIYRTNKTLCERIFGRGRTASMVLWTCLIAAKELSSYLTREDKSFIALVCWTTHLIQYVPLHNKNSVISRQCLKICTSSMQTCLEPNCKIGHKWLQPGE